MNRCIFCGRTTKDVELKYTQQNNTALGKFSLAVDTGYGDKKKTSFLNMTVWGKSAEAMEKYVTKGTKVIIEAEAVQNVYTDKNGNKVYSIDFVVLSWEFAETKKNSGGNAEKSTSGDYAMDIPDGVEDDGLPFA